jgi:hypothetical protein
LQLRIEAFYAFNHANFFGPAAVNGDIDSSLFGQVVRAAGPGAGRAQIYFLSVDQRL